MRLARDELACQGRRQTLTDLIPGGGEKYVAVLRNLYKSQDELTAAIQAVGESAKAEGYDVNKIIGIAVARNMAEKGLLTNAP